MMAKKSEPQSAADVRNKERYSSRTKWKESKKNCRSSHEETLVRPELKLTTLVNWL
jgi:hypothetical protein